VMTSPQQEQVGQHRDPHGVRTPFRVATDLMLAQSQPRFEFPIGAPAASVGEFTVRVFPGVS
jgi:hypothetical protein